MFPFEKDTNKIKTVLSRDERIIWLSKPAFLPFLTPYCLLTLLIVTFAQVMLSVWPLRNDGSIISFFLGSRSLLTFFVPVFGCLVFGIENYRYSYFAITDVSLIIQSGVFAGGGAGGDIVHQLDHIDLRDVNDVRVRSTIFDIWVGKGSASILIFTESPTKTRYKIKNVKNPAKVVGLIKALCAPNSDSFAQSAT